MAYRQTADEARLRFRFKSQAFHDAQAEKVRQVVRDSRGDEDPGEPRRHERTKPGDPRQLRGIPVLAKGVGGTQPGTAPHGGVGCADVR